MKTVLALLVFLITATSAERSDFKIIKSSNNYYVRYFKNPAVKLNGRLNETVWRKANKLNDFILPWEKAKPQSTVFRAFFDNENFYFSFQAVDTTLVVLDSIKKEEDIENEDRGEIYFAQDSTLANPYYCAEIDAKGRVLDYKARYHRQFDFSWNWPEIKTAARITNNGYVIEGYIPIKVLKQLGFKINGKGTILHVGVYRADFEMTSTKELVPHWQAWIDSDVNEPDYHVPASFGKFYFTN